jgi:hypothetical protein
MWTERVQHRCHAAQGNTENRKWLGESGPVVDCHIASQHSTAKPVCASWYAGSGLLWFLSGFLSDFAVLVFFIGLALCRTYTAGLHFYSESVVA